MYCPKCHEGLYPSGFMPEVYWCLNKECEVYAAKIATFTEIEFSHRKVSV